eukprot:CAMPEP_0119107206 /NCGR_PEP_ID=MMETSP1180-20130426/9398_1 /TAXON_ID=3052 ORGANISM="Chlamydomonas cf sp, Strain CCMP681" /NCGR_SAMPLE_ID=MMETSP1180 /ASSEMBLY_ACC=CAM_ASM_000741 /LENGTH=514 /DNA_ID=CAMNT_0007092663 /DNA_START=256 /DNA_END=1800 /DNA_ORIENTATION=-
MSVQAAAAPSQAAPAPSGSKPAVAVSQIGLVGLAVMGQNLALNIAEKGFSISVCNRSYDKTEAAVKRATKEGLGEKLTGYKEMKDFVASLQKPRRVIILVKAGGPVDQTVAQLTEFMEKGDIIIDGGNEWYENTERRKAEAAAKGLLYLGMGVSGGEEGARNGPSMMPGGSPEAYKYIKDIVEKVAAQVEDGPCVAYIGDGGSGNFVKMVHNGIEYGDMQLISEAYDILRTMGGLTQEELTAVFTAWNKGELASFLIEITAIIMGKKDDQAEGFLVNKIMDQTGAKGTGKWTVQQAAELSVAAPTITASLDGRYMSALKPERIIAAKVFSAQGLKQPTAIPGVNKAQLIEDVAAALYASKICSYAQGLNIIKAKSEELKWGVDLGMLARIWKGGCIIRAVFLEDVKQAYARNPKLANLLIDPEFAATVAAKDTAWRRVVCQAITAGVPVPGFSASLSYFDSYRRESLPANLVQAQRDFFGSHTYQRTDKEGWFHTVWDETFGSADSITTGNYNA